MVENSPGKQEPWVWSLGQEDPLEKEMATYSSIPAWTIPWTEELVGYSTGGRKESHTTDWLTLSHSVNICEKEPSKTWIIVITNWQVLVCMTTEHYESPPPAKKKEKKKKDSPQKAVIGAGYLEYLP